MMNSVRSFWLMFMASSRWVQGLVQSLVIGVMVAFGYYTVLKPERVAVDSVRQHILRTSGASAALVWRLEALPALLTLQQQWDYLSDKLTDEAGATLSDRLLHPLSTSGADLLTLTPPASGRFQSWLVIVSTNFHDAQTFIQQLSSSPQPLHIHSIAISSQQDALHLEMQLTLPGIDEERP